MGATARSVHLHPCERMPDILEYTDEAREKNMKKRIVIALTASVVLTMPAMAGEMMQEGMRKHGMMPGMHMHGHAMHGMGAGEGGDARTSLGLPAPMRAMQKKMMREHLQAINDIVALIAAGNFDTASGIAHKKLGLTPEMKKMCDMFANDDFRRLGLAFHKSADELGEVLKTGDTKKSLNALHTVMNSCVQCHATFRQ